ncbi:MAG: flagellar motor protein MotD, partial [Deltaproteobacteria bacterium]|nr:flagellar motor protein MotD [Deltaproteobacteria bacterium]
VAAVHLGGAGYGEHQPALPNDPDANRAQNRRVEIILMPNIEELPDLSSLENPTAPATPAPAPAPAPAPPPVR